MLYEINQGSLTFRSLLTDKQRIELTKLADQIYQKSVFDDEYKPIGDIMNSAFFQSLDPNLRQRFISFNR